ncbi:serine acetyltransferase [Metabacillus indicus]
MRFLKCVKLIKEDYYARNTDHLTILRFVKSYIFDLNYRVVVRFRIQTYLFNKGKLFKVAALMIRNGNLRKFGVEIGLTTKISGGLNLHHINGIVIGDGVKIGNKVNIFQQVTVGKKINGYPLIGDNVTIYPGSKIIGKIIVGDNAIIGANSVVSKDIACGVIVAGVPAREITPKGI